MRRLPIVVSPGRQKGNRVIILRKEPTVGTDGAVQATPGQSDIDILRLASGACRTLDRDLELCRLTLVRVGNVLPVLRQQRRQTAGLGQRLVAAARRLGQRDSD